MRELPAKSANEQCGSLWFENTGHVLDAKNVSARYNNNNFLLLPKNFFLSFFFFLLSVVASHLSPEHERDQGSKQGHISQDWCWKHRRCSKSQPQQQLQHDLETQQQKITLL
jgi:hypothetical protein